MAVTKTNKSTKSTKANKNKSRVQRAAPAQSIRRSDRLPHIQPAPQPASTPSVSTGDHTTTTDPSLQQAAIITIPEEHCESVDTKLQYVADMRKVDVSLLKLQLPTAAERARNIASRCDLCEYDAAGEDGIRRAERHNETEGHLGRVALAYQVNLDSLLERTLCPIAGCGKSISGTTRPDAMKRHLRGKRHRLSLEDARRALVGYPYRAARPEARQDQPAQVASSSTPQAASSSSHADNSAPSSPPTSDDSSASTLASMFPLTPLLSLSPSPAPSSAHADASDHGMLPQGIWSLPPPLLSDVSVSAAGFDWDQPFAPMSAAPSTSSAAAFYQPSFWPPPPLDFSAQGSTSSSPPSFATTADVSALFNSVPDQYPLPELSHGQDPAMYWDPYYDTTELPASLSEGRPSEEYTANLIQKAEERMIRDAWFYEAVASGLITYY